MTWWRFSSLATLQFSICRRLLWKQTSSLFVFCMIINQKMLIYMVHTLFTIQLIWSPVGNGWVITDSDLKLQYTIFGGVPNDILEQVSCQRQKGCKTTFMLVTRLILYVELHLCVTKVKIVKAQLILATKMTAMINKSSLLCVNIFSSLIWYCATLCFKLFTYILSKYCNKIRVGKQKFRYFGETKILPRCLHEEGESKGNYFIVWIIKSTFLLLK